MSLNLSIKRFDILRFIIKTVIIGDTGCTENDEDTFHQGSMISPCAKLQKNHAIYMLIIIIIMTINTIIIIACMIIIL